MIPATPRAVPSSRSYAFGALAALLVTVAFISGFFLGEYQRPAAAAAVEGKISLGTKVTGLDSKAQVELNQVDFQQFWDVWKTVKAKYVSQKDVTDEKLFYGAIQGMVGALGDPYSVYFEPVTAKKFNDEMGGTFEGIGAEIGMKKGALTIIAPLPGTPALKAGVKAGDFIIAIDGTDTTGMTVEDAVSRIRGPKATKVKLRIVREGLKEPKEMEITRAKIVVDSVKLEMKKDGNGKKLAVVTVSHFNEDTESLFADAVRKAVLENPAGLVLDLRNNPGGYLDAAVRMASEWVGHETVVSEQYADGTKREHRGDVAARLGDLPTVVLVNGGSASASEIVAGALQDSGKAKLVGEKTFGKGSVQDYSELSDGSALKITVALWLTPKGRSINKEGIVPDVTVKNSTEDWDESRDPQYDKAVQMLTGYVNPATKDIVRKQEETASKPVSR
jgi:carboxyl-terminal processing protease